jgi:division protein CdvB (Snf7/Vps24/ESCRT-III family)
MAGDLKDVNEKLEEVIHRLNSLEAMITETRRYPEVASLMHDLKIGAQLYDEPLKMLQRLLEVKHYLDRNTESKDEITREVLNVLALKGPMNISELTREIASIRGKASRVTVKKHIDALLKEKIVSKTETKRYQLI